jgi:hypothetical protein
MAQAVANAGLLLGAILALLSGVFLVAVAMATFITTPKSDRATIRLMLCAVCGVTFMWVGLSICLYLHEALK